MKMKRFLKILLLLLFPMVVSAQLDKMRFGTSLGEVKRIFPGLKPDVSAMSSIIYTDETLEYIDGHTTYTLIRDTVCTYDFQSKIMKGPCYYYPHADSSEYNHLMKGTLSLYNHFTSLYGSPSFFYGQPIGKKDSNEEKVTIFIAKWVKGNNLLSIEISRPGHNKRFVMNGPPPTQEEMKEGCNYVLEVISIGTGKEFSEGHDNGITGAQFKKLHPLIASQVVEPANSWMAEDTLTTENGTWRFDFDNRGITSLGLDIFGGPEYSDKSDEVYLKMRKRVLVLFQEAQILYGKPDSTSNTMPEKYKQENRKLYHYTTYFNAKWKLKDKKLFIIFDKREGGKQFEPVFHLEAYCGKPVSEE